MGLKGVSKLVVWLVVWCSVLAAPGGRSEARGDAVVPPYAVAYSAATGTGTDPVSIFALRADGGDRLQLSSGGSLDLPTGWSPDGSRLAFERIDQTRVYSSVFTVGLDGRLVALGGSQYDELPAWSPDGSLIAYQEQTDYGSGGGRADTSFDLLIQPPDGTSPPVKLDTGGTSGGSADWVGYGDGWAWSPDSRRIAVVEPDPTSVDPQTGEDHQRLGIVDVASRHVRVRVRLSDAYPDAWDGWAWSPDGRRIAYLRPGSGGQVALLDVGKRTIVGKAPVATRSVAYQGDSLGLAEYGVGWAWAAPGRLAVVQPDRTNPRLLRIASVDAATGKTWQVPATLSTRVVDHTSLVTQWTSSRSGRQLALFAAGHAASASNVVVADLVRHSTRSLGPGTSVTWSPDGRRLAVVAAASSRTGCGTLRIISLANGSATPIVKPATACDGLPEWSNDGSAVVFTRTQQGTDTLIAVSPNGTGQHPLTPVPASTVLWPADCEQVSTYQLDDWLLRDSAGALQLVRRPQLPDGSVAAWRC